MSRFNTSEPNTILAPHKSANSACLKYTWLFQPCPLILPAA